jgi:NAD(P)-dependent dehydrogenase (short-subunit alcohol dehydrogenase family)
LTGYPEDMLSLDMDIEADLGIDSIKRVEILSAVTEKMPQLASERTDHLGSLRTLQQIVDSMMEEQSGANGAGEGTSSSAPFDCKEASDAVRRRLLRVASLDQAQTPLTIPNEGVVWITDDGTPLAAALVEAFEERGLCPVLLPSLEATEGPLAAIGEGGEPMGPLASRDGLVGLVLLSPSVASLPVWEEAEHAHHVRAFALASLAVPALSDMAKASGAFCVTVTRMDGAFGLSQTADVSPLQGGLAALPKTLLRECPAISCRALDVSPAIAETEQTAKRVAGLCLSRGALEVGLDIDQNVTLVMEDAEALDGAVALSPGDAVVVSGGARGVTAAVALELAKAHRPHLFLLGRSPLPEPEPAWLASLEAESAIKKALLGQAVAEGKRLTPKVLEQSYQRIQKSRELTRNLRQMKETGASVTYLSVDARDGEAIAKLFASIRQEAGPIRMLIHAAGVIEDKRIAEKSVDSFRKVYETKVKGLHAALSALEADELRYLVLFSSVSGRTGNTGQVDYAMANEVLNKVARQQAVLRPSCHVMSLNWGPWDGGMVKPALKRMFESKGIALIGLQAGARAMLDEMRSGNRDAIEVIFGSAFEDAAQPTPPAGGSGSSVGARNGHASASVAPAVPAGPQPSLPLLAKRVLDVESHPVLLDHVVGGRPIVPVALMMEWLGHAAVHGNPGLQIVGYDDLRVMRALALVPDAAPLTMQLRGGKASKEGKGLYRAPLTLWSEAADGTMSLHAKADAILGSVRAKAPDWRMPAGLTTTSYPLPMEAMYRQVLFHGPALQGMTSVKGHSARGMEFEVRPEDAPSAWMIKPLRRRWLHAPLAMDCAFQAAILWCQTYHSKRSLPSFLGRFRQYAAFPSTSIRVVFEVTSVMSHKVIGQFAFVDQSGQLLAQIEGYECTMDAALASAFRTS